MKQWLDTTDKTNTDGMIRLALNKRIRTCEDEKKGGGDRTMSGAVDVFPCTCLHLRSVSD